mmetsp:Transcript_24181/g.48064  ORF Transcript_24181/g.48064 Transcript_24181/m.48064 type:complete len:205 (+) Transcript_24181:66-680(+)
MIFAETASLALASPSVNADKKWCLASPSFSSHLSMCLLVGDDLYISLPFSELRRSLPCSSERARHLFSYRDGIVLYEEPLLPPSPPPPFRFRYHCRRASTPTTKPAAGKMTRPPPGPPTFAPWSRTRSSSAMTACQLAPSLPATGGGNSWTMDMLSLVFARMLRHVPKRLAAERWGSGFGIHSSSIPRRKFHSAKAPPSILKFQ